MEKLVPRKRGASELEVSDSHSAAPPLPQFDDPQDMINAVISTLQAPEEPTNVATNYANDKSSATEVQAYAKIAGTDWTFYVKSLAITIGRNTEGAPPSAAQVDIDLGPAKVVSRSHASITYNLDLRCWEFKVFGRNGARVDGQKITPTPAASSTPLHSGAILDIGGTQMMFILPDSAPSISPKMLQKCLSKYKDNMERQGWTGPQNGQFYGPNLKPFQMFDKAQLASANVINTTSAVSATSLQNNLDQDLSKEESKDIKPPYSYATMITQAILSNEEGVLSLSEIYNWISSHYAYYKYSKTGWQNSIRHNLSLNKAFEKVPRRPNEPGKGMKWQIAESYKSEFMDQIQNGSINKSRRGSSVSRQLHLHLAMHKQLPESKKYYNKDMDAHPSSDKSAVPPPVPQQQQPPAMPANPGFSFPPTMYQAPPSAHPGNVPPQPYGGSGFQPGHQRTSSLPKISPQQPYNYPQQYGGGFLPHHQRGSSYGSSMPGSFPGGPLSNTPQAPSMFASIQNQGMSSPLRQMPDLANNGTTPKLPNSGAATTTLYNLPPPTNGIQVPSLSQMVANPDTSYGSGLVSGNNSSHTAATSTGSASNEIGIGFTSPKKVAALEAYTPERGPKVGVARELKALPNQSSPAFWNFVQFSTPNGQTPMRKHDDGDSGSPTISRKLKEAQKEGSASPLKSKAEEIES